MRSGELTVSDGSNALWTLDSASLAAKGSVRVVDGGVDVARLNELEMIEGEVCANVWMTDCVARIDPSTGQLRGWVILEGLRGAEVHGDVLNGIAWDAAARRLLVTVRPRAAPGRAALTRQAGQVLAPAVPYRGGGERANVAAGAPEMS